MFLSHQEVGSTSKIHPKPKHFFSITAAILVYATIISLWLTAITLWLSSCFPLSLYPETRGIFEKYQSDYVMALSKPLQSLLLALKIMSCLLLLIYKALLNWLLTSSSTLCLTSSLPPPTLSSSQTEQLPHTQILPLGPLTCWFVYLDFLLFCFTILLFIPQFNFPSFRYLSWSFPTVTLCDTVWHTLHLPLDLLHGMWLPGYLSGSPMIMWALWRTGLSFSQLTASQSLA